VIKIKAEPFRFDDARNIALSHVPPEYNCLISLDLDEVILPETGWKKEIKKKWCNGVNRLYYDYTVSHSNDGTPDLMMKANKIHDRNFSWHYPVHEVLRLVNENVKVISADLDGSKFRVHHQPDLNKDRANYLPLLELSARENPNDGRCTYYLARENYKYGKWADAIELFKKHLVLPNATWKPERAARMRFMARCYRELGDHQSAETWYLRACAEIPDRRDAWIELGKLYLELGYYHECNAVAQRALRIPEGERNNWDYISDNYSWNEGPYDLIAISAWKLGRLDEAREFIQKARELAPNDSRIERNYKFLFSK